MVATGCYRPFCDSGAPVLERLLREDMRTVLGRGTQHRQTTWPALTGQISDGSSDVSRGRAVSQDEKRLSASRSERHSGQRR